MASEEKQTDSGLNPVRTDWPKIKFKGPEEAVCCCSLVCWPPRTLTGLRSALGADGADAPGVTRCWTSTPRMPCSPFNLKYHCSVLWPLQRSNKQCSCVKTHTLCLTNITSWAPPFARHVNCRASRFWMLGEVTEWHQLDLCRSFPCGDMTKTALWPLTFDFWQPKANQLQVGKDTRFITICLWCK